MKEKPIIEVAAVQKTYARATEPSLRDIHLNIYQGERVGLIGANGSGKTTLLRLLMNFVLPDEGSIRIMNEKNLEKARRNIGFVPERQEGMENFTPRELMEISAKMFRVETNAAAKRIEDLLALSELTGVGDKLLSGFSKGMRQRVHICIALIHDPQILLLDEPMSGLDPAGQHEVRQVLNQLSDLTMIYASHNLEEIETLCNSVVIMHEGRIIQKLDLDRIQQEVFTLDISPEDRNVFSRLDSIEPEILREDKHFIRVQFVSDADTIQKLIADLDKQQISVKRLRSKSVLEDLYYRYVKNQTA